MKTITRPALRYLGSKWRLAPWVISHFPKHSTYVEPYGGSMAVMLRKKPIPLGTRPMTKPITPSAMMLARKLKL